MRRVLLLREAGGLGDVVNVGAVARSLKAIYPDMHIIFAGLQQYADIATALLGVDEFIPMVFPLKDRRGRASTPDPQTYKYLTPIFQGHYDKVVDLYCPGVRYEATVVGDLKNNRIDCFCFEAGLGSGQILRPVLRISHEQRLAARALLEPHVKNRARPLVGLQIAARDVARTLPIEVATRLVSEFKRFELNVVVFNDDTASVVFPDTPTINIPMNLLGAVIEDLNLLVAVDSGLGHIAGAVGQAILYLQGPTDLGVTAKYYERAHVIRARATTLPCQHPCNRRQNRGYLTECRKAHCKLYSNIDIGRVVTTAVRLAYGIPTQDLVDRLFLQPSGAPEVSVRVHSAEGEGTPDQLVRVRRRNSESSRILPVAPGCRTPGLTAIQNALL